MNYSKLFRRYDLFLIHFILITVDREGNAFSFANPLYSPTSSAPATLSSPPGVSEPSTSPPAVLRTPRPSYKVEDIVVETNERPTSWRAFKRKFAITFV